MRANKKERKIQPPDIMSQEERKKKKVHECSVLLPLFHFFVHTIRECNKQKLTRKIKAGKFKLCTFFFVPLNLIQFLINLIVLIIPCFFILCATGVW